MTKYVFEDHPNSGLAKLFRALYPKQVSDNFVYTEGATKIVGVVNDLFSQNSELNVVVYIDVVPDNYDIQNIYNKVRNLAHTKYHGKLFVLPIICMEYYLIKAFAEFPFVKKEYADVVSDCISFCDYHVSRLIETDEDRDFCKTYEGFCKLVQMKAFVHCAAERKKYGKYFYENDCVHNGVTFPLALKSEIFLRAFPCIPLGIDSIEPCNVHDCARYLTELHNKLCDVLRKSSYPGAADCRYIQQVYNRELQTT